MHAATCIASVTGAWQYEGGGAFHNNGAIFQGASYRPLFEDHRARLVGDTITVQIVD